MKWIVLALVVVSAVQVLEAKRCKTADDCEEGECCVNYVIVSIFGGHCKKLRQEGESCTPLIKDDGEKPDMYHFQCPCKEGLDCKAKHEIKIGEHIIKHRPECVVPGEEDDKEIPEPDPE
ncbi:prokineticin domain-containing protein [Trichonephila inaurata madagascariensis]|uniref:Prokineticin domain-containing protein n=1 Tax=Trichonephila inaurata madagascariensis TaxID=2747483 RepID=A0A8X6YLP7_9ARAC|nr:prokineticin domain-containing protein [Trichonephila inaurata madagascariensis]